MTYKRSKERKKDRYENTISEFDRSIALDVPFGELNKRGRKAKKKTGEIKRHRGSGYFGFPW